MFAISVVFKVDPAHREEFAKLSLTHAHNSESREEGCLDFRIFQSPDDPNTFYFHEAYKNRAAAEEVHARTEYLAAFRAATDPWIKKKDMGVWESVE